MKSIKLLLSLGCAALTYGAQAQVLLEIDFSDLNAVKITSSTRAPANDAAVDAIVGVTLMDFFTSATFAPQTPVGINSLPAGLKPTLSLPDIDTYLSVGENGTYTGRTLNLNGYVGDPLARWSFRTDSTAFTGETTANFSQVDPTKLPGLGVSGDILVGAYGATQPPSTLIGQWEVVGVATPVPEPATVGLAAGLALGGFAFARRRMKKD